MAQLRIPLDAQRFATGMTWKDYVAQMGDTRARTEENYAKSVLTEEERKVFSGINHVRYVLMLAENWCGDVHRNSPLIAHICDAMPNCDLRVFLRDQNPDLRDALLNNGFQSIPVVVFFDKDWNEVGRWIERAHAATAKVLAVREDARPGSSRQAGRGDARVPEAGPGRVRRSRRSPLARRRQRGEAGRLGQEVARARAIRPLPRS